MNIELFHTGSLPWVGLFLGIMGSFIGSFLGVVIDRLPYGKSIVWGRSHCDFCKKHLQWFELIPVVSYMFQRGRCIRCNSRLSWRYPCIEIVTGVLFAATWAYTGPSLFGYISALIIICSLVVIVVIDLDHMIIPDIFVITTTVGAIAYHLFQGRSVFSFINNNFVSAISSFILFYLLWRVTKRRGIGFGDVKLSFALGLLVGFPQIIISLYVAFLTGAFVAIILLLYKKKTMKSAVPFGPFLIFGAIVSMIVDSQNLVNYFL